MVRQFIRSSRIPFIVTLRRSIKLLEIEETYDLLINRPLGLLFAFAARRFNLTPTQVSVISLVLGMTGGALFYFQNQSPRIIAGAFLVLLAGILDSTDGQLARLTNQSSKLGMIIDGAIDNLVFTTLYLAGCAACLPEYGLWIVPLGLISGFCHSTQSLIYDFYKNEFSYWYGNFTQYRNPGVAEVMGRKPEASTRLARVLGWIYLDYVRKQNAFTTRTLDIRAQFEARKQSLGDAFYPAYKRAYEPFLTGWALSGGTVLHTWLIILFSLAHRFDVYLLVNIGLMLPLGVLTWQQYRRDLTFLKD